MSSLHPFIETITLVGGIGAASVASIVLLTLFYGGMLFYRGMSWITKGEKADTIAVHGGLEKDTFATVDVAGHKPCERLGFMGFINPQTMKTQLP